MITRPAAYAAGSPFTPGVSPMKYGMNLLLWTGHVTQEHYPLLAKLKQTGFDGVEIPIFGGEAADYQSLRKELDNLRLRCTAVTIVTPEANPISPDANVRKAARERLRWTVEMSAILGVENLCGPYHSPLGVFSGAGPTEDEKARAADVLRSAAEFAQQNKVMLAIEYLN